MIFSSLQFIIFFILFIFIILFLKKKNWPFLILVSSYIFYSYQNFYHSFIILFLAFLAIVQKKYKFRLSVIIPISLLPLIFYKYTNFFVNLLYHDLFGKSYLSLDTGSIPIGISFVTFTVIAYFIDIKSKSFTLKHSNLDILNYIFFFPQLIAGPILRPGELVSQIQKKISITLHNFNSGMILFSIGIFKKVFIADTIGQYIDPTFNSLGSSTNNEILSAFLLFPFQIYFDFSGYTDMAIGLARVLGIKLPENFNRPYLTSSIREFWQKWHITLSNWIRDYIYFPLGGSKKGEMVAIANVLIAMSISGLWHGASYNFLLWGLLNGIFIALERYIKINLILNRYFLIFLNLFIVFNLWVLFRSETIGDALIIYNEIYSIETLNSFLSNIYLICLVIFFIVIHRYDTRNFHNKLSNKKYIYLAMPLWSIIILFGLILSQGTSDKFIYFDF